MEWNGNGQEAKKQFFDERDKEIVFGRTGKG
jgi:hypothetical protein